MDATAWDERYGSTDLVWSEAPNGFFAAEAEDLAPGRALDLGAGEGRNAVWLARRGWAVTAVDFSSVGVAKGAGVAPEVTWIVDDVVTWEPEAGAFDLVLVAYIHLPEEQRRAVLGHAAAALAPGGTLVVVGHDVTNLTEGTGGPQDPAILYSPDGIVAELVPAGLAVERAERMVRATPAGPAVDTLVRVRRPPV